MDYRNYKHYRRLALESSTGIAALKDIVSGGAVYIVGSGPSIAQTDLSRLNGETIIFLNNAVSLQDSVVPGRSFACISDHLRAIELRPECNTRGITCLATTDKVLNPSVSPLIFAAPFLFMMPKFLTRTNGDLQVSAAFGFSDAPGKGVYLGKSVVFPAIQIAWHMGARDIFLVGLDMTIGAKAAYYDKTIKSNWSAFKYERDGRPHFELMRDCLSERGCILQNLTVGGALDVLPHDPERLALPDRLPESEMT
jgi:hypothetical protein